MYKVSIIIPVYNVEKYIERCALSLFNQTFKDIEYIFVDDKSPDSSIKILKGIIDKYPNRKNDIKIISHSCNKGLANSRNTGRSYATGEYIISCDSDDWIENNMIELMYNAAIKNKADIVICDWNIATDNYKTHIHMHPSKNPQECAYQILSGLLHGSVCNKLIKRNLYIDNNIKCIDGINIKEDLSVTYKLFYFAKKVEYINKPLYNYFKSNNESYMSSIMSDNSQYGIELLSSDIDLFFQSNLIKDRQLINANSFFKANALLDIIMKGRFENLKTSNLKNIPWYGIIFHPKLKIYHKLILSMYKLNFLSLLSFLRNRYQKKFNIL